MKHLNTFKLWTQAIAIISVCTACVGNEDDIMPKNGEHEVIRFSSDTDTKASVTDSINIQSFRVFANLPDGGDPTPVSTIRGVEGFNYFEHLTVLRQNDKSWNYYPKVYWPNETSKLSFYAYSPVSSVNVDSIRSGMTPTYGTGTDKTTLYYTIPTRTSGGKHAEDFLIATVSQSAETSATVNLAFRHALSMVSFRARHLVNDDNVTVVIDSIQLINLAYKGSLTYGDFSIPDTYWKADMSRLTTYRASVPGAGLVLVPPKLSSTDTTLLPKDTLYHSLTSDNETIPVMPQSFSAGNVGEGMPGIKVWLHAYTDSQTWWSKESPGEYTFAFPVTYVGTTAGAPNANGSVDGNFVFQMGKHYDFSLELSVAGDQIIVKSSLEPISN
jgi:hypothetical protein